MMNTEIISRASCPLLPALINRAGKPALRFDIRNKNTCKPTLALPLRFYAGAKQRALTGWQDVQPVHVACYVEQLGGEMSPPSVKQHLA